MSRTFLVAGGDLRQVYLAEALAKNNCVYAVGFDSHNPNFKRVKTLEGLSQFHKHADYLILPLPASDDGITVSAPFGKSNLNTEVLTDMLAPSALVLGGKMHPNICKLFADKGFETIDYFKREELNIYNAVPTAEGAIQLAMEELATTISGQRVLITGFGRIGRVLAATLHSLGAKVTAAARKYSDLAWAEVSGCETVHMSELCSVLSETDLIFNTVPSMIFDKEKLGQLSSDALIIDLASKPGGVDFNAAGELGIRAIWALSLPGKVAPITSGKIIASTITNILRERGITDAD